MQVVGLHDDSRTNDPRHHFLGMALCSEKRGASPLISTVIYCSVANRIGMDTYPGKAPHRPLAVVRSPPNEDLNGQPRTASSQIEMYLDPAIGNDEIGVDELFGQLNLYGIPRSQQRSMLGFGLPAEVVVRASQNIQHALQQNQPRVLRPQLGLRRSLSPIEGLPDLEGTFYGSIWPLFLVGVTGDDRPGMGPGERRPFLASLVEQFETNFQWDASLIEKHIVPIFRAEEENYHLRESVRVVRSLDSMPRGIKPRRPIDSGRVKYRVGQVFTHRRYGYEAVITGWDVECAARESWIVQMQVDELSRGRRQSFYHVL